MFLIYVIILITLVALYLKKKFSFWKSRGVLQSDLWNPLGDLWDVGFRYHFMEKVDVMYKQFKGKLPFYGFYTLTVPVAVVTDLDLLRSILVKDFSNFIDRGMYHDEAADKLTMHLFNIEGEKWKKMRYSLSPTFTSGKMKGMFHIIEEKAQNLVKYFENHSSNPDGVELRDAGSRFTADVVASTAFGLETHALEAENPQILSILKRVFNPSPFFVLHFLFLSSFREFSAKLKFRQFAKDIEEFFENTIKDTISHRESNGIKRNDFLNMLINLKNRGTINDSGEINHNEKITFNEVLAQAFIFFQAGYETSSVTLHFAMYFLGKYSKIQNRLRNEVREKKEKYGGKIDYEALMEMTYLHQVMNETLRYYSPASILVRKSKEEYPIQDSNLVIPADTIIQIPVHSIHHDPEYYPNPEEFNPDRFTPEEIAKRHPYAFLPFGEGPRNCIGMRFAQLQVKYALAVVVDTFELSVNLKTKEPLKIDKIHPIPAVEGGIWMDFKKL